MSVSITWGNQAQEFLVILFEGNWELEDFHRIIREHDQMLDPIMHKVHILIDTRKSQSLPKGFLSVIRKIGQKPHPKVGKMAMLGMSAFIRAFIDVIRKIQPDAAQRAGMHFVGDAEEAYALFRAFGNPALSESEMSLPLQPMPIFVESNRIS